MPYTLSAITFYWKYIRYNFNKLQVYSIFESFMVLGSHRQIVEIYF